MVQVTFWDVIQDFLGEFLTVTNSLFQTWLDYFTFLKLGARSFAFWESALFWTAIALSCDGYVHDMVLNRLPKFHSDHWGHMFPRWSIPGEVGQYHSYWCPDWLSHQVISSHDINCIVLTVHCLLWKGHSTSYATAVSRNGNRGGVLYAQNNSTRKGLFNRCVKIETRRLRATNVFWHLG